MMYTVFKTNEFTLVDLFDEVDMDSELLCNELKSEVMENESVNLIVNFEKVKYLDSIGVRLMISLYKKYKKRGGTVRFCGLTDQPLEILKLCSLDKILILDTGLMESIYRVS